MGREEEIRKTIDKIFPCTDEGRGYEESIGASGFELGAKWADEHPKNVWHDAKVVTPPQDDEVIVLLDGAHCGSNYKIAFGHIVDKTKCVDYNGWNIPDVVCWMPCPQIPYEKDD